MKSITYILTDEDDIFLGLIDKYGNKLPFTGFRHPAALLQIFEESRKINRTRSNTTQDGYTISELLDWMT
jgi:hypothetical protein